MEAILWGQKRFDSRLDRKSKNARIENQFMLDDDNVGIFDGARGTAAISGNGSFAISLSANPPACRQECGSISEAMKVE